MAGEFDLTNESRALDRRSENEKRGVNEVQHDEKKKKEIKKYMYKLRGWYCIMALVFM